MSTECQSRYDLPNKSPIDTKEHEWIRVEGDTGTLGITDFAQQQLGDVVYVEVLDVVLDHHRGPGVWHY